MNSVFRVGVDVKTIENIYFHVFSKNICALRGIEEDTVNREKLAFLYKSHCH